VFDSRENVQKEFLRLWFWSHSRKNLVTPSPPNLVKILKSEVSRGNLCSIWKLSSPSDYLPTTEAFFDFSQVLKLSCSCTADTKWNATAVKVDLKKTDLFICYFANKSVAKGLIAAFVIVHAGSYSALREKSFNISYLWLFVFFHCCNEMKYSCYQDSSVIRSWFISLFIWLLGWGKIGFAMGFNESESWTCRLFIQQGTGIACDLTYSLLGAASKVNLSNYYSFCLVSVLLWWQA